MPAMNWLVDAFELSAETPYNCPTMFSKSFVLSSVGSLLVTFTVWAGTSVLEGVVKDPNGRPVKGADVRIEAKNFSKIVKTDANGRYVCDGLGSCHL